MLLLGVSAVCRSSAPWSGSVAGLVLGNLRLPVALLGNDRADPDAAASLHH